MLNQSTIAKVTKHKILDDIYNQIDLKRQTITGKIPYNYVARLVASHSTACPWLTRDCVNNEMRRRKKKGIFHSTPESATTDTTSVNIVTPPATPSVPASRIKGGRPVGTTQKNIKHNELAIVAAKNETTEIFVKEKKASGKKRLPPGRLAAIISEVKKRNFVPDDLKILESTIRPRVKKQRLSILQAHLGPQSPLSIRDGFCQNYDLDDSYA